MLARSLDNLQHQDFGYRVDGRVLVGESAPATYTQPQLAALYRRLEDRLNSLPGIQGSGLALYNPLTNNWGELILVSGHPAPKMSEEAGASWDRVSAHYLQNFGMTILRGRHFTEADNETTAPVAIVNQAFVKRFFKSDRSRRPALRPRSAENIKTFRIVGIVRDASSQDSACGGPRVPCSTSRSRRTSTTKTPL